MQSHFDWSDDSFIQDFEGLKFPVASFNHEAHLRLAFLHIQQFGLEQAIQNITHQLKAYVNHLGVTDKYNETLTVAAVFIVNHFQTISSHLDFQKFMEDNQFLKKDFQKLVAKHYSFNIFEHPTAKTQYQAPDLLPFV